MDVNAFLSDTIPNQELPNDYIIQTEYYDRYRLVFSHFHLDRKIGRIGLNEKQKRSRITASNNSRSTTKVNQIWDSVRVSRETDYIREFATASSQEVRSQNLLH